MSDSNPSFHPPSFFAKFFTATDSHGDPVYLVGGHAVNLWAEHFVSSEPELEKYLPFSSKDLDIFGNSNDLFSIATKTGLKVTRPEKIDPRTVSVGKIYLPESDGKTFAEVLQNVNGVTHEDLKTHFTTMDFKTFKVRVPLPHLMLNAKIENLYYIPQQIDGEQKRQDEKHVRIMMICNRAYIMEKMRALEAGIVKEKSVLILAQNLLEVVRPNRNQDNIPCDLEKKYNLDWKSMFPIAEMSKSSFEKIRTFATVEFPRVLKLEPPFDKKKFHEWIKTGVSAHSPEKGMSAKDLGQDIER